MIEGYEETQNKPLVCKQEIKGGNEYKNRYFIFSKEFTQLINISCFPQIFLTRGDLV